MNTSAIHNKLKLKINVVNTRIKYFIHNYSSIMNERKVPQVGGMHRDAQRLETGTEQVKQLRMSLHSK
jgi:hypothetical protein